MELRRYIVLVGLISFLVGVILGIVLSRVYMNYDMRVCVEGLEVAKMYIVDLKNQVKEMREKFEKLVGVVEYQVGYSDGKASRKKRVRVEVEGEKK